MKMSSIYTATYFLIALHFTRMTLKKLYGPGKKQKRKGNWPPLFSDNIIPVKPMEGPRGLYWALRDIADEPLSQTQFRNGILPEIPAGMISNTKKCLESFKPALPQETRDYWETVYKELH